MINQTDIDRINLLTSDIKKLDQFISEVKKLYLQKIKKIYLIFDGNLQVEFSGRLSQESTAKLLQIIVRSRELFRSELDNKLTQCMDLIKSDREQNPKLYLKDFSNDDLLDPTFMAALIEAQLIDQNISPVSPAVSNNQDPI